MDPLERAVCPLCSSDEAVVAFRGPKRSARYCPDCDHAWEEPPPVPPLGDAETLRVVMRAFFADHRRDQQIARAISRPCDPNDD